MGPALDGPRIDGPRIDQPVSVPYSGPPLGIDGPVHLPPPGAEIVPELIAPGIGPEELVPFADSPIGPILPEAEYYAVPQKLSSYKDGFFQKLSFSGAWIGTAEDPADLGVTEIELFLTVALPAPIKEWPLFITPGINMYFLDGPGVTDLPPRLNTAYVDFMWAPQIFHRYRFVLSVAPSVLSDFQSSDADMFRLTGKGLVVYDWAPDRLQLVAGLLYLNRDDVRLLPAGGLIWKPAEWTHFELIFPKPKLAVRFGVGEGYEDWLYGTAEFGGNTWSIQRDSGAQDKVTYLDYRLLLGVERKLNGGAGYRIETGYVFGRTIEFASGEGDFDPQNTFILRGGLTF
ncbi:MAG: hypothetical protein WD872_04790 [Pirellulaceae bacterium]